MGETYQVQSAVELFFPETLEDLRADLLPRLGSEGTHITVESDYSFTPRQGQHFEQVLTEYLHRHPPTVYEAVRSGLRYFREEEPGTAYSAGLTFGVSTMYVLSKLFLEGWEGVDETYEEVILAGGLLLAGGELARREWQRVKRYNALVEDLTVRHKENRDLAIVEQRAGTPPHEEQRGMPGTNAFKPDTGTVPV